MKKELGDDEKIILFQPNFTSRGLNLDLITMESKRDKTLGFLSINEGATLYVEFCKQETQPENYLWQQEVNEQENKIYIQFNVPTTDGSFEEKFDQTIFAYKQDTLEDLKNRIGEVIALDTNRFIIKKVASIYEEIKDLSKTLGNAGLKKR